MSLHAGIPHPYRGKEKHGRAGELLSPMDPSKPAGTGLLGCNVFHSLVCLCPHQVLYEQDRITKSQLENFVNACSDKYMRARTEPGVY